MTEPLNELMAALAKAQASITAPTRNREVEVYSKRTNAKYTFRYATLDAIIEHIRKPLTENGLWFIQRLHQNGDGKYRLVTTLTHASGQSIDGETPILAEDASNQGFGSALTYMRRYSLCAMLGIAADEDDDANRADGNDAKTKEPGWHGPLGKTALKARLREFDTKLHACKSADAIDALVNDYGDILAQVEADLPQTWRGEGDITGTWDTIEACKRTLESGTPPVAPIAPAMPPARPAMLAVPVPKNGEDMTASWKAWAADLAARLDQAPTVPEVNAWIKANAAPLKNLATQSAKLHKWIEDYAEKRRGLLAQAPKE